MPIYNTKLPRFNSHGTAALKQEKRIESGELKAASEKLPAFCFKGFWFEPYYGRGFSLHMNGPLCPVTNKRNSKPCLSKLSGTSIESKDAMCPVCEKSFSLPYAFQEFREVAHKAFDALLVSKKELITLDVPYSAIKAEAKDKTREIKVVWSQKDGRNMALIYLIDRAQNEGDKTHIFIDIDRQEIRHDAIDENPGNILSEITAIFKKTTHSIKYK